jgi:hypothetical protein
MNFKTLIATATLTTTLMMSSAFAGGLDVSDAWARASAGAAQAGGAFLTVHNPNHHAHTLLSAASPVAKKVELHTHTMEGGMMKMRQVEGGIAIPAGETVKLQPGGYHVMLMGLHAPLKAGTTFPVTLTFDGIVSNQDVTIDVKVLSPTAMGMPADHSAVHGSAHDAMHGTDNAAMDAMHKEMAPMDHGH